MRGDWLKIWIARQPRSVPRSTALARPPASETCAPISMAADYEGSSPGAWQGQKWLARADVTPDEVRLNPRESRRDWRGRRDRRLRPTPARSCMRWRLQGLREAVAPPPPRPRRARA